MSEPEQLPELSTVDPAQVLAGYTRNTPRNHPDYVRYDAEEKTFLDNAAIAAWARGTSSELAFRDAAVLLEARRALRQGGLRQRRVVDLPDPEKAK